MMRRRTIITGAIGALAAGALPRAGLARVADALVIAYAASTGPRATMNQLASAVETAGWRLTVAPGQLRKAASLLGESQAVAPYTTFRSPDPLTPASLRRAKANIATNVENAAALPYPVQTWTLPGTGASTYLMLREDPSDGTFWCIAATTDALAGRTFIETAWPGAPDLPEADTFIRGGSHQSRTPLFGPAARVHITLTQFNPTRVSEKLGQPFEATTGFLVHSQPGR